MDIKLPRSPIESTQNVLPDSFEKDSFKTNPMDILLTTTEKVQFLQSGIDQFFRIMFPHLDSKDVLLQTNDHEKFMAHHPEADTYQYPKEQRIFVFYPEGILQGSHPGDSFLVGIDSSCQRVKLRAYPSMYDYFGVHFRHPLYGTRDSRWLVGCTPANDGAANIVFALPLNLMSTFRPRPIPVISPNERARILEQLIAD